MKTPTKTVFTWAIITMVAGLLIGFVKYGMTMWRPIASVPQAVDFGPCEADELLERSFTVRNTGWKALKLDSFHANCPCRGLEIRSPDGTLEPAREVTVSPRSEVQLTIRQRISLPVGASFRSSYGFATTDPNLPVAQVVALFPRIIGEVQTIPAAVPFGTLVLGGPVEKRIVHVWDSAQPPRPIATAQVQRPQLLGVKILAPEQAECHDANSINGTLVGHVEITPTTNDPMPFDDALNITLAGRDKPLRPIPISGRTTPRFAAMPASVLLPLRLGDDWSREATILIRDQLGQPFTLRWSSPPASLELQRLSEETATTHRLKLRLPPTAAVAELSNVALTVIATLADGTTATVPFSVMLRPLP